MSADCVDSASPTTTTPVFTHLPRNYETSQCGIYCLHYSHYSHYGRNSTDASINHAVDGANCGKWIAKSLTTTYHLHTQTGKSFLGCNKVNFPFPFPFPFPSTSVILFIGSSAGPPNPSILPIQTHPFLPNLVFFPCSLLVPSAALGKRKELSLIALPHHKSLRLFSPNLQVNLTPSPLFPPPCVAISQAGEKSE